ncbi:polysaccharide deacetylase family protein [Streptomyces rectiverticillatus]|uniref:polysaccharide deacetylase family protein n=1 Tax=Streptomyces rectiverticillatus TaxID=173860 RepID=UPI0015C2F75F|nr:polysaccharide deacetylase family protein [Streptomyces rectiverticillatus]QLE74924.1 polysaccharide deacetylase family protein [Streptomyces rectiverticillatus]
MALPKKHRNRIAATAAVFAIAAGTLAVAVNDRESGGTSQAADRPAPGRTVSQEIEHLPEDSGKAVNLTIDDGPDPTWTPKVLNVLKEYGAKATFCMTGPNAQKHPDLVGKVVAAGHRLCDHSMSHDTRMDKKPVAYQEKEILDARRLIEEASGGEPVRYYRAPGGAFTPDSRRIAAEHGMRPLGWNVDTKDFERPGVEKILDTVERQLGKGPTILMHDAGGPRAQTVEALGRLLPKLKQEGYAFSFPRT